MAGCNVVEFHIRSNVSYYYLLVYLVDLRRDEADVYLTGVAQG
jgi:hypothetical protein